MSYLIIRQFWNFLFYARVYLKKKKSFSLSEKAGMLCSRADVKPYKVERRLSALRVLRSGSDKWARSDNLSWIWCSKWISRRVNKEQTRAEKFPSWPLIFRLCLIMFNNRAVSPPPRHNKDKRLRCDMSTESFHYLDLGPSITRLTGPTGLY